MGGVCDGVSGGGRTWAGCVTVCWGGEDVGGVCDGVVGGLHGQGV